MALQSSFYEGTALESRTFPTTKHIPSKQHMAVWLRKKDVTPEEWEQLNIEGYQLINNSAVLNEKVNIALHDKLEVRVADEPNELVSSPSDIAVVASIASEITTVAGIKPEVVVVSSVAPEVAIVAGVKDDVVTVASIKTDVQTVSGSITSIQTVAASISSVNAVAPEIASVVDVAGIKTDVADVALIKDDVTDVATVKTNIIDITTEPLRSAILAAEQNALDAAASASAAAQSATDAQQSADDAANILAISVKHTKANYTGSVILAKGTTADRDTTPSDGYFRYNSELNQFEGYRLGNWGSVGGGATGGGSDDVFYENSKVVTADYTITAGKNAITAGPVTINDGVTVTVPDGSNWVIV